MAASRGHKMRRGVWILPMGVDVHWFRPGRRRADRQQRLREWTLAGDAAKFLLYVGRLAPEKNLDLLIDVMVRLTGRDREGFHLIVAGDGPKAEDLRAAAARRLAGRVTFLGHVGDREALADLYANADVFVHTNPREPFGIAPLEAMASGTPVVLPNTGGGASTYASQDNSWATEPEASPYASAVADIIGNPRETARRVEAARRTAEEYSWETVAESYLRLYREIHALRKGQKRDPAIPPAFYSSDGNWLGQEV
jgi:glycosyltransferase involved in cell wall biosynthesis